MFYAQFKCPIIPARGMPSCRIIEDAKFRQKEPPTPQQEAFLVSHSNSMMNLTDLRRILHNDNHFHLKHTVIIRWGAQSCPTKCPFALCYYPNVSGAIRNSSLNSSTAPIFCNSIISENNIWVRINIQFHFLYIFEGQVDRIHRTTILPCFFPPLQTKDVLGICWPEIEKRPIQIFGLMKI